MNMQMSIGQAAVPGMESFPSIRAESAPASHASTANASSSATVTANDFLQLLVTEMKNQDPTANTDPNEYINQLVQVNSLEQLVQINQDLGGDSSSNSTNGSAASTSKSPTGRFVSAPPVGRNTGTTGEATGNLPLSGSSAAAARVAQALQFPSGAGLPANLQNPVFGAGMRIGSAGVGFTKAR